MWLTHSKESKKNEMTCLHLQFLLCLDWTKDGSKNIVGVDT
jgi:hypothetical protein